MTEKEIEVKILEKAGLSYQDLSDNQLEALQKKIEKVKGRIDILMDSKGFREFYEEVGELENIFDGVIKKVDKFGAILKNKEVRMAALQGQVIAVASSIAKDMFNAAVEVRQELGVGVGEAAALGAKITVGEKALKLMGGRAGEVQSFA